MTGIVAPIINMRMDPNDALRMIKRRAKAVGLSEAVGNHTFRATDGTLEQAQEIANHASPKTTKLYGRSSDHITLDMEERILIMISAEPIGSASLEP